MRPTTLTILTRELWSAFLAENALTIAAEGLDEVSATRAARSAAGLALGGGELPLLVVRLRLPFGEDGAVAEELRALSLGYRMLADRAEAEDDPACQTVRLQTIARGLAARAELHRATLQGGRA